MRDYLIMYLTIIALLMFTNSCKEEHIDREVIRPLIKFTTTDIPTFNGMIQTNKGEIPRGVTKIINDSYTAEFEFKWVSEEDDYAYFDIRIMGSLDMAINALTEMHNYYSNPFIPENIDEPSTVGDISYLQGREFIRDNLIIRIHTSEKFDDLVPEIAKHIDSKLLESLSFMSISQVKPIIKDFKINKNPVVEQSQTPMTIQIEDPNDKDIVYQWRFDKDSGYGGVAKDISGIYYYTSGWYDSINDNIGLTLIAINEFGFCADSTINIQIVKE